MATGRFVSAKTKEETVVPVDPNSLGYTPAKKKPEEVVAELYGAMSLSEQSKYEDYVVRGEFYLKYGNLPKVQQKYTAAFAQFNPITASDEEKAFIAGVQNLLGVTP